MVNFTVSAPGKVILFGEHAVVYGKRALAASLGLRTYLTLTTSTNKKFGQIKLNFKSINLKKSYTFEQITPLLLTPTPTHLTDAQYAHQLALLQTHLSSEPHLSSSQHNALLSFLFLLTCILSPSNLTAPITLSIDVSTELTVSAGLGSSASFLVCVAAGLICFKRGVEGDSVFTEGDLREFSNWAFNAERIIHGTPSGVDNTICTYGALVEFCKGTPPVMVPFPENTGTYKLRALLVNTMVPKDTKKMVTDVAELHKNFPHIVRPILESIDKITEAALHEFKALSQSITNNLPNSTSTVPECIKNPTSKLEHLSTMNQHLLAALGVSHPALDRVCAILAAHNIRAKLTGGGGGGYAIALVPSPIYSEHVINAAITDLKRAGFEGSVLELGGWGVRVETHNAEG